MYFQVFVYMLPRFVFCLSSILLVLLSQSSAPSSRFNHHQHVTSGHHLALLSFRTMHPVGITIWLSQKLLKLSMSKNRLIFLIYFYFLFTYGFQRERENGRGWEGGRERERNLDLFFHLWMHSLVASCMCSDQSSNTQPAISPWCSNQLSPPARARLIFLLTLILLGNVTSYLALILWRTLMPV